MGHADGRAGQGPSRVSRARPDGLFGEVRGARQPRRRARARLRRCVHTRLFHALFAAHSRAGAPAASLVFGATGLLTDRTRPRQAPCDRGRWQRSAIDGRLREAEPVRDPFVRAVRHEPSPLEARKGAPCRQPRAPRTGTARPRARVSGPACARWRCSPASALLSAAAPQRPVAPPMGRSRRARRVAGAAGATPVLTGRARTQPAATRGVPTQRRQATAPSVTARLRRPTEPSVRMAASSTARRSGSARASAARCSTRAAVRPRSAEVARRPSAPTAEPSRACATLRPAPAARSRPPARTSERSAGRSSPAAGRSSTARTVLPRAAPRDSSATDRTSAKRAKS